MNYSQMKLFLEYMVVAIVQKILGVYSENENEHEKISGEVEEVVHPTDATNQITQQPLALIAS